MVRIRITPRKKAPYKKTGHVVGPDPGQRQPTAGQLHATPDRRCEYHEVHQQESRRTTTSSSQQDGVGRLWSTSPPFSHGGPKQTTPKRQSSSTGAQEETRQTKNLPDPDGTGRGLSQHCAASVFSPQTIELLFLGGTSPSQQTESGPVAIKGPPTHPPRIILLLLIMSDIPPINPP